MIEDSRVSHVCARGAHHTLLPLRVAVSTRALFDVEDEHAVFESRGVEAYESVLRAREATLMAKGAGFEAISRLLRLNEANAQPCVEVVVVSRNAPEASLRAFASAAHHNLKIVAGSFTGGGAIAPLLAAWGIDLFLSRDAADVAAASAAGIAAATLSSGLLPPTRQAAPDELRIAFDGDAVLFGDEAEEIFAHEGLRAFLRHEAAHADDPLTAGPLGPVLQKLAAIRAVGCGTGFRTALVTARTAPAHARAINTLRAWGIEVDEAHFVGGGDKSGVLAAFGAHIFFDDKESHVISAGRVVASAQVPRVQRQSFRR